MFSQFFGQFLLSKGHLSADELLSVLDETDRTRVKLGTMAISDRMLSPAQVEEIHAIQASEDKRFGQIAIEQGYLTEFQLDVLLTSQKNEHHQMVQVLFDRGIFNLDELDQIMEDYRESNGMDEDSLEALKNGEVDTYVELFLNLHDAFDIETCRDYVSLYIKSFIRFVDRNIRFEAIRKVEDYQATYLSTQVLEGTSRIITGIGGSSEAITQLAVHFSQEPEEEVEDIIEDAVGEFLNLQNGLFAVNMSDKGMELNLEPQIHLTNALLCGSQTYYVLPVIASWGRTDLVLGLLENQ